jgi:two-component system OmpR family response regulator
MAILLVEDETALANYIVRGLSQHNIDVDHIERGDLGLVAAQRGNYELAIIDRMLPGLDGLSLVKSLRKDSSHTPVLILSNLGGLDDRVEGLNAGADDYLAKPFAFSELLARVHALLRRPAIAQHEPQTLKVDDLEIDRIRRKVTRSGQTIALQPREFSLLEYLMKHSDQIVTRTMLLEAVWNYHFDPKTHIVETHISRLRGKIGADIIQTIRGSGYLIRATKTDA